MAKWFSRPPQKLLAVTTVVQQQLLETYSTTWAQILSTSFNLIRLKLFTPPLIDPFSITSSAPRSPITWGRPHQIPTTTQTPMGGMSSHSAIFGHCISSHHFYPSKFIISNFGGCQLRGFILSSLQGTYTCSRRIPILLLDFMSWILSGTSPSS